MPFKASTLDEDFQQILHISQEALEGGTVRDLFNVLNMHGYKISNLGKATADGDAVSLGQVKTESASAWTAAAEAKASAAAALLSKNTAAGAATDASASKTAAAASVTAAASAASSASSSSASAGQSAVSAGQSSASAKSSATAAAASEASASDSASTASTAASSATNSKDAAEASAVRAETAAGTVEAVTEEVLAAVGRTCVPGPTAPTTRADGSQLQAGDTYFNTDLKKNFHYTGTEWFAPDIRMLDLANAVDPGAGAALVGFEGGTVADALRATTYLDSYENLRAYTGPALRVRIKGVGRSEVVRDSSVSGDDGITKFLDAKGRQWRRVHTTLTLEQCGVAAGAGAGPANAAILVAAIVAGVHVAGAKSAYTFDFTGMVGVVFAGSVLQLDLGPYVHTFLNWRGITANSLAVLEYTGRVDASGTYCKGLGRFRNLRRLDIGNLEFLNVFCTGTTANEQFFGIEYSSDLYGDNELCVNIKNVVVKNVRTKTVAVSEGSPVPMTILGNYGSTSTQKQQHKMHIGSFHMEEYYSVGSDGVTPIDGDSDVLRLFTNPTQVVIGNLYAKNIAKRFFKSQEAIDVQCGNVHWENDSRFPQNVFIGFFESQIANSGIPSRFRIGTCTAIQADGPSRPLLFNASGLDHTIEIEDLRYKNIGMYSASSDVGIKIHKARGTGLTINAPNSTQLHIQDIKDTCVGSIRVKSGKFEDFDLGHNPDWPLGTIFYLGNLHLVRGTLRDWHVGNRVAEFLSIDDVKLLYSHGSQYVRGLRPPPGDVRVRGLHVSDATKLAAQIIEAPTGSSGRVYVEGFRGTGGTDLAIGVATTGTWVVRLNDCEPAVFNGAGATTKTATYA